MEVRGHILSRRHIGLALGFCLLNIADAAITMRVVANGIEATPLMRILLNQSPWMFWSVKVGLGFLIASGLLVLAERYPTPVKRILRILVIAMAGICLWNLISL